MAERMGVDETALLAYPEREAPAPVAERIRADFVELAAGRPPAHLFGHAPFLDWDFLTDPRALAPRPETEALAARVIQLVKRRPPRRILDLCCGGGALGLALTLAFPESRVLLTDLSAEALALCQENVHKHRLEERVRLRQGDLWAAVPPNERFDLIVANPPYVAAGDPVEPSVLVYEPELALFSGDGGMACAKRILAELPERLERRGSAALELGHEHHRMLAPWLEQRLPPGSWRWERDPFDTPRFLFLAGGAARES